MDNNGYEPKCKLCQSKFQDLIENMRENDKTYEDIKDFLRENGEEISLMAISRHFNKHYPVKKVHVEAKNLLKQEKLDDNKRIILETITSFPYLEELFNEEVDWEYRNLNDPISNESNECIPKTFKEVFLNDYGYCTSGHSFCENVPKKQIYCVSDALFNLDMELSKIGDNSSSSSLNLKIGILEKQLKCANCIAYYNDCFNDFIIYSTLQMFDNKLDIEEFKRDFIGNFESDNKKAYDSLITSSNSFDSSEGYL